MPLIIISGYPTSGKSTRAKQLYAYLSKRINDSSPSDTEVPVTTAPSNAAESSTTSLAPVPAYPNKYKLHLISDETLSISRKVYDLSSTPAHVRSANASEKDARAAIYGAVKRVLSDRDIVILDGLNYIKGWRYQLYCEAKAVRTGSCVLQVGCPVERAREVNEARLRRRERKAGKPGGSQRESSSDEGQKDKEQESEDREGEGEEGVDGKEDDAEPYSPGNWENLVFRYEEPNPMTKWDSPLFPIIWTDDDDQTTLVFDKLWNAIAGGNRKVIKPNKATAQRTRDVGADYLYVLDRETQDIVKKILEAGVSDGGEVKIPTEDGNEEIVVFPAGVGLARLQRLRRAFVGLHRGGIGLESVGNMDVQAIRVSFLGYLNDAFEREGE